MESCGKEPGQRDLYRPTLACGRHAPSFSKLFLCGRCIIMCLCVYPPPRLLIASARCGVIWTPYDWLNKGYSFYMTVAIVISGGYGLRIEACYSNQPNKGKLLLYNCYFYFKIPFKQLYTSCKTERFSYKDGCSVCGHMCTHIKVFKRRAGLDYR